MKKILLFFFLLVLEKKCWCQDVPVVLQQQIEDLAERLDEEDNDADFLEQLVYLKTNPLDLNNAGAEEFHRLHFLNQFQIDQFIAYRNFLGKLIDIHELQAIPGFDPILIKLLLPYVRISDAVSLHERFFSRFKNGDQSVLMRISRIAEKSKGYLSPGGYLGDPNHIFFRYRYSYKNLLTFGLTGDKDAGEQFFKGTNSRGFDFYSFHFFVSQLGIIKSLAIGDFTINLGQGLIQWQSSSVGKSADVINIKRQSPVLLPYRSSGEFNFNRGFAITLAKKKLTATFFLSHKKISGNLIPDSLEIFSSFNTSGYYRTLAEISDKNISTMSSVGGNVGYLNGLLKLGINAVAYHFEKLLKKQDEPYNYFSFNGKNLFLSSIDYGYTFRNIHFFGELAVSRNFHTALLGGAIISVDPKIDLSFLYRNIQKSYQSLFASAFTENSLPENEKGFYTGICIRPLSTVTISVYSDFYSFPWLRYRADAPGFGYNYLFRISYEPDKKSQLYLAYYSKNKPVNSPENTVLHFTEDQLKETLRFNFDKQLTKSVGFKTKITLLWLHQKENEEGFLSQAEVNFQPQVSLSLKAGCYFFETDSYNSRIYSFEPDVLYSTSTPQFSGHGSRFYGMVNFSVRKKISFWLRWAQFGYQDVKEIGSGLDIIEGNKKSEIKLQATLRL